jgi:hypothetical protein
MNPITIFTKNDTYLKLVTKKNFLCLVKKHLNLEEYFSLKLYELSLITVEKEIK